MQTEWLRAWRDEVTVATSLVVVAGDAFDPQHRNATPPLLTVHDQTEILDFAACLELDECGDSDVALMMPAIYTFVLLHERQPLVRVSYLEGGWLRPADEVGDRRLKDDDRLREWLSGRGCHLDGFGS
jgi:hypothetical protein